MNEAEILIKSHELPIPRNWEMRIQRVFSSFGLEDFTTLMKPDYFECKYPVELYPRDYVWSAILSDILEIWENHKVWSQEVAMARVTWDQLEQCEVCGHFYASWRHGNKIQSQWGEVHACDMCRRDIWRCVECGDWQFGSHDRCYIGGMSFCNGCFVTLKDVNELGRCVMCGSDCFLEDLHIINDSAVCPSCYDERICYCLQCDTQMIDGIDRIHWMDDESYCPECHNEQAVVAAYDYFVDKPPFLTLSGERVRPDSLFFGLEFEIEDNWKNREVAERQLGQRCLEAVPEEWGYCKHDGSMFRGVEWVTHPMSPLFYKANRKKFDKILNQWAQDGFRVDQWDDNNERYNCGLHMHMSKAAFTSAHLYKFVRFFYKVHLRKLVQQIAERDANHYAKWRREDLEYGVSLAKDKRNISGDRYSVINLIGGHWHENHAQPAKTVEFRLFQGTLDPKRLHKNIEFMLSVYYFTRDNSLTHITEKNYLKFLGQTKNRWRYLTNFLRKHLGKEI
jgi:hypothetical protein